MSVLLDTGVIFAYLNRQDAGHRRARELMTRIARKEFGAPFVTDHVVDELFVLIRARTGSAALEESAHRFLPLPSPALRGLTLVSLGAGLLEPTWQVFRKHRDQGLSFTDASLIVTMREMAIERLATFDPRLGNLVSAAV